MLRPSLFALVYLAVLPGCERAETPPVAAPPASLIDAEAVSGTYEVRGVTVQASTGRQREIAGTLELGVEGARYEVGFDLGTSAPDLEEPVPVRVRGTGRGLIVGEIFTGTTEEWMALDLPMEDAVGVPLPANAGRKIVSTSQASIRDDGAFQILLQNYPGHGESYDPSVTVLTGRLIEPAPAR